MYNHMLKLWDCRDGHKKPISLEDWRIMNVQLCVAAAQKLTNHGPPKGGVGQKHWQEHSDGTKKTSELPDAERFGHTVIRFSTVDAQYWYEPLVASVLGTAQDGRAIKLSTEKESEDGRARYVFSLQEADFNAFGNSKEEREHILKRAIFAVGTAQSAEDYDKINEECSIYSSFLFQERNRDNMWKIGIKLPIELETQLDSYLKGEKFGIIPTAITGVRVLKKQNSKTLEEKLSQMKMAAANSTGESKRGRSSSGSGGGGEKKKVADQATPEAMKTK